jgi:hypothetical protein
MRGLQNLTYKLGQVAELEVAVITPKITERAHDRAKAAAVNECDLAQVHYYRSAVAGQARHLRTQQFGFTTGNDAPITTDNDYVPDFSNCESKTQVSLQRATASCQIIDLRTCCFSR